MRRWIIWIGLAGACLQGGRPAWTVMTARLLHGQDQEKSATSGFTVVWNDDGTAWKANLNFVESRDVSRGRAWVRRGEAPWAKSEWLDEAWAPSVSRFVHIHGLFMPDLPGALENHFIESEAQDLWEGNLRCPMLAGELGPWKYWLIEWETGANGLGGSMGGTLLVALHRPSGAFRVKLGWGMGLMTAPTTEGSELRFLFNTSRREKRNCWVLEPWNFEAGVDEIKLSKGHDLYRWFSSDLVADNAQDARHWAHQEVAWHISSADEHGGVAEAFEGHARWDREAGEIEQIRPLQPGTLPFRWRSTVVVRAKQGRLRWVSAREALDLARNGGWDVVLERQGKGGEAVATWLVAHDRDLPHSTAPTGSTAPPRRR